MKSLFSTKTFWFNVLSGLGLFIALPELTSVVPPAYVRYVVLANAAINIALRYITTQPVNLMGDSK
jgi:hypothetical protein